MAHARDAARLAGDLFSGWIARREASESEPFDDLVKAHPECAEVLRAMLADWEQIEALGQIDTVEKRSFADQLQERFGSGFDPEVSLDDDASVTEPQVSPSAKLGLYGDLQRRGPTSGRYRIDGQIAQGGMGVILRVHDKNLRRNLAMKVMREEKEHQLSRFLEEAQITGQLDHPGIVPVHDLGIDLQGKVFFTMKLVKGRDLRKIFDLVHAGDPEWSMTRAVDVLKRVCEAMAFAHDKSVIHRDLKPSNIMVDRHGEVYVMDWGLAKVLGRADTKDIRVAPEPMSEVVTERQQIGTDTPDSPLLTIDGHWLGTPSYMPIEQAEGRLDEVGTRSDIYAIGAMLYHLLAGHAPFVELGERVRARVVHDRVKRGPPRPVRSLAREVPIELIAICEKSMARKAVDRYETMSELGDDLRAYLERRVVKAHRTGVLAETQMWIARSPVLATAIGLLIIALGGIAWQQSDAARKAESVFQLSELKDLHDIQAKGKALLDDRAAVFRSYRGFDQRISEREQWIAAAEAMRASLARHESTLREVESRGTRASDSGEWLFETRDDGWWHSALEDLVRGIRSLSADTPPAVSIRTMRERIDEMKVVYTQSILDHLGNWEACIASIANPEVCPLYRGMKIVPQVGLVPIGQDPKSGLWEFWYGDERTPMPKRDPTQNLVRTRDFGLVFVLIPGGTLWMGAQSSDPNGQNYDPEANRDEGPVRSALIDPFFLSKYEMTKHQWKYVKDPRAVLTDTIDASNPMNLISWTDIQAEILDSLLEFPKEAEWEYACRAGKATPWSTGMFPSTLLGYANLSDVNIKADLTDLESGDDNLHSIETVGNLLPNDWGLHDMHGNLSEWCRNEYTDTLANLHNTSSASQQIGTTRLLYRTTRGGDFLGNSRDARSSARKRGVPDDRYIGFGFRPCRRITD